MTAAIQQIIREHGPLPFPDYMALALYDPQSGYYARGIRQVGREGDFFTSVSVGPLFGMLLARRFLGEWKQLGQPDAWRITECGAHDGRLALDILNTIAALSATAYRSLEYAISEPLASLRKAQANTLATHQDRLRQVDDPGALESKPGIIFGNEVLDALPCHLVERREGRWLERLVGLNQQAELDWALREIESPAVRDILKQIGDNFPDGYRTELRTLYHSFMLPLRAALERGRMIWIDYGFERSDYYHPGRREGTLRTFGRHQAGENPLADPGRIDISAHVDFTAVAEASLQLAGTPAKLESQGSWLTRIARDWLLEQEGNPDPKALRQFQTLTHPGHLGRAFQVLEVEF